MPKGKGAARAFKIATAQAMPAALPMNTAGQLGRICLSAMASP